MFRKIKSFLFENTTTKQTVAKNTFWLTVSNFGGRMLRAVIVIYGARVLGTDGWGIFSYAVTLAGFLTFLLDPGVNYVVMREVPKSASEEKLSLLSTAFFMKVAFILAAAALVLFAGPYFTTLPGAKALLPIVVLIVAFDTMREFLASFIRAMEKMEWETGIYLLTNVGIVVAGFAFLAYSQTAKAFGWAYVTGTAVGLTLTAFVLRKYLASVFSHFSKKLVIPIMHSAWPFAVTSALGILLTNTDILIISWMRSASEVGIYSAAIRIVQIFYIVPMILQFAALPTLARLANHDNEKFRSAFERTIGLIFLASIPLALGGVILGTQIMTFLFGPAFAPGGLAFKLLMVGLIVDYPATIISAAIFAYDHQKSLIVASAIGGIGNVILDIILIPPFGIAGSAVATLLSQVASNWYLWHKMKSINRFEVLHYLRKIITAGVVMAAATALLLYFGVNVLINIAASGLVYFLVLYAFHEPLLLETKAVLFHTNMPTPSGET